MNVPLVTILLPVYNAERYVAQSLESILRQTFTDFELLVINDGSTDRSEEIIKRFKDSRIRFCSQINKGISATLNYGIALSKGKYIRRHDADDISTPNSLKEQIDFITTHSDVGMVASQQAFMTERGKIAYNYRLPRASYFNEKSFRYVTLDDFTYEAASPIIHGTVLYERSLVSKLGGYRSAFFTSEDNDLWTRIMEHKKIAILNSCSYHLRLHSASYTRTRASSILFYRKLVKDFALERSKVGTDPLMRSEPMPAPENEIGNAAPPGRPGRLFRADLLNYSFKIAWDAKDWREIWAIIWYSLKDGWRLSSTWKTILFTLLGHRLVSTGVELKSKLRLQRRTV